MSESAGTTEVGRHGAVAEVATASPDRYAKQLAAHLGRRSEIREEASGTRIVLAGGSCLLESLDGILRMTATASTPNALEQVQQVVGSHLVRFGQRNELEVSWQPAT